jgi:ribosomal-protein-alanine N-acetyltransferase
MRDCVGIKVEKNHKIVGFMIYQLYKHKFHILNLAVSPSHRRCKIGGCMVSDLIRKLSNSLRTHIDLEVRETNVAAQQFFHSQGFEAVKVLRGFYEDSGEDAYLMKYHSR